MFQKMTHEDFDYKTPKSSRRRRWEVKSKESFEDSLAYENESPDKIQLRKNGTHKTEDNGKQKRPKSSNLKSVTTRENNFEETRSYNNENSDLNAKLSALLDSASQTSHDGSECHVLRESEENLIKSELKHHFPLHPSNTEPSAPPMTPPRTPNKPHKTPKKKVSLKVKPIHSGANIISSKITQHLQQLSDDIVDNKEINSEVTTIPGVAVSGLLLSSASSNFSGSVSTIYCEKLNNFVIASEKYIISTQKNKPVRDLSKKTKKQFALLIQNGFRTFSVLCQGLLAGITVAHCLMVFLLEEAISVILTKSCIEHTFFIIIFFLSALCLVSAFDRCDLAGQGVFSEHGLRIPWTPLLYMICVTLTLVMVRAEDFILYFNIYSEDIKSQETQMLTWWKYMCLVRTLFTVLAWIGLVADPHTDALSTRISELTEE